MFDLNSITFNLEYLARRTRPSETFLSLCAKEGQARFSLDGRLVQGYSYLLPNESSTTVMMISLQRLQLVGGSSDHERSDLEEVEERTGASPRAYFEIFTELSQAMASNLDWDTTIKSILESIERLIPADYIEVTIWEPKEECLIPYRLFGVPGTDRHIEQTSERYSPESGYSGYLVTQRSSLFITDVESFQWVRPTVDSQKNALRSYLGVPLLIVGELVGTLELGSTSVKAFTQDDLDVLNLIAGQAAIALNNARLYQEEQHRAQELAGLAHLAQVGSTFYEDQNLISRLVKAIRPLLEVEILGFLIYDESRRILNGEVPFWGLPPEFVELYQTIIPEASKAEEIWLSQEIIHTPNAPDDSRLQALGLDDHAIAAGMQDTVLVPLTSSERRLGYIQIANKLDGTKFDQDDLRFLAIIAGQTALILANAELFKQSQRRAQRAEALRRIASLSSSVATKDEILKWSLQELAHLIQADAAAIFLLDESASELRLHKDSLFGVSPQIGNQFSRLFINDSQFSMTVTGSQQPFFTYDASQDIRILPIYKPIIEKLNFKSAIDVPLVIHDRGIGEIMFGSFKPYFFNHMDIQTVATAAGQLAGAIEQASLSSQTDDNLQRQVNQLTALTRISRDLNTTTDLQYLLKQLFEETLRVTSADCGTIFLLNHEGSNGKEPKIDLYEGDEPGIPLQPLEKTVLSTGTPIIIQDFEDNNGKEYLSPVPENESSLKPAHAGVCSALIVPIICQGRPVGLIHLHARNPHHFDPAALEITQALSVQAAIAHRNAQLYQNQSAETHLLNKHIQRFQATLNIGEAISRLNDRSKVLTTLSNELHTRMDMEIVLVAESSPNGPRLLHSFGSLPPGINPGALLGQRNPIQHAFITKEKILVSDLTTDNEWQNTPLLHNLGAGGFMCLPVLTNHHPEVAILGISLSPLEDFTFEDEESLDLLIHNIAITLENADQFAETKQRLREVDHLLEFSRQVVSLEPGRILQSLVDTARRIVPTADAVAVAMWEPEKDGLVPKYAAGYANTSHLKEIVFPLDKSLPGSVLNDEAPTRFDEIDFPMQYDLPTEHLIRYRDATGGKLPLSSLLVPITSTQASQLDRGSALIKGVLILDSFAEHAAFSADDQALITSLAHQTALTLENMSLYQASEQRTGQLQALTSVSAMIASSLQSNELIALLLDQMQAVLPFDTGTLWLRDGSKLTVRAVRGFPDTEERVGLSVAIEDSQLFNQMVSEGQPIYVSDIREDPRFPALIDYPYLSWLGIPWIAKGEMIGVIALEKSEVDYYTSDDLQLGLAFTSQAAIALENANLFKESVHRAHELDKRTHRLALLNRLSKALSTTFDTEQVYRITIQEIIQAVNCTTVSVVIWKTNLDNVTSNTETKSDSQKAILITEQPSKVATLPQQLPYIPLFDRLRQTLGIYSTENALNEKDLAPLSRFLRKRNTHSLLILPIPTSEDLHGLLLLQKDHPYHYSAEEVELVRTIGNQAAIAIENAHLFAETRRLTQDLERRVNERTTQLAQEHKRTTTLLRIITELSASLDLELVLKRTLKVLNEVIQAEQIYCLVRRPGEPKLKQIAQVSANGSNEDIYEGDEKEQVHSLAAWVISNRKPALITDFLKDQRWQEISEMKTNFRSAIGVLLVVGEEAVGVLLLFHSQAKHFSEDQLDLIQATGNQIAITINNAELYNLIRDQAEDLGNLLRNQQIETSTSRAILESVAEGVLVTDAENKITLFNAAAENILDLDRKHVVGRSLEHFTGLFGRAASSWMGTIRTWSGEPTQYQPGETYSERINIEDDRVVSIQLAPVYIQDEFLGTVSIFHDISHQVEVDRLKTEFVATVSHELRTPMTSIKGYVDILLMGAAGVLSDQQTHFLKIVQENTQRLTILVNDLLDISRIEANRMKLTLQPLDLRGMAEKILSGFKQRSEDDQKPIQFNMDIPSDLPRVTGDPERVRQILFGLLDNAYHYTPESGLISLRGNQIGDQIQVDVIDNGIGVPLKEQKLVFERFFRGEDPMVLETSGTGLGLSVVQHLVNMHGGKIWLESAGIPGEGSTFSFTLPVYNLSNENEHLE